MIGRLGSLGGALLLLAGAFGAGVLVGRRPAPADPEIARLETAIDSMEQELDSLRPLAERSDSVATVEVERWNTVLERVTEQLPVGLPVPWPVFIGVRNTAAATITACTRARDDCRDLRQKERARADSLERDRNLWRRRARPALLALEADLHGGSEGIAAGGQATVGIGRGWQLYGRLEQPFDTTGRRWQVGVSRGIRLF